MNFCGAVNHFALYIPFTNRKLQLSALEIGHSWLVFYNQNTSIIKNDPLCRIVEKFILVVNGKILERDEFIVGFDDIKN